MLLPHNSYYVQGAQIFLEPLGAKGLFEVITERYKDLLSVTTAEHTPWTRRFYARATTDPQDEAIEDLVEWTALHFKDIVLKPVSGYSGHGIFVGRYNTENKE